MAVVSLTNMRDILLPYFRMTPEERAAAMEAYNREMAVRGAAERTKYDAMSQAERDEYDALTDGMMPRLAGASERMAERRSRNR